jgi:D-3-phosphoglycerate dehydrogenase / 2-oxoglutarate reductase
MKILCITPVKHINGVCEILESYGEVVYIEEANFSQARHALTNSDFDVIYVNPNELTFRLDAKLLNNTSIKAISTASTGTNHIDLDYCEHENITVLSLTKEYNIITKISSTAEHAFALMMAILRNIPRAFEDAKQRNWNYRPHIGRQLNYLTIGIIGYGRLGTMMAAYCKAFGMNVLVCDPYKEARGHTHVTLAEALEQCDIISLHVHLNNETKYMIDKYILDNAKNGIFFINTSRGEIVNEPDMIDAIRDGKVAGYATDVICDEFGSVDNSKLLDASESLNIIVTPHIAGMTKEAQEIAYGHAANRIAEL